MNFGTMAIARMAAAMTCPAQLIKVSFFDIGFPPPRIQSYFRSLFERPQVLVVVGTSSATVGWMWTARDITV